MIAISAQPRTTLADGRVQLGGSANLYIPTDPHANVFVSGGPRFAASWVSESGWELGYIYSPLRLDAGLIIDHGLLFGRIWRRDTSVQPFARISASYTCENHTDYYDRGYEYDTCSGPLALRTGVGARLVFYGPFAVTVETVIGVVFPTKVAVRHQLALGFDAVF